MVKVTITLTDIGEWSGEHERPSAAYARALVQAYPNPTTVPVDISEQWLAAVKLFKAGHTRVVCNDAYQSVWITIERIT